MPIDKRRLELCDEDLLGFEPDELRCTQCAPACNYHLGRVYKGSALIMCGKKPACLEVMRTATQRR